MRVFTCTLLTGHSVETHTCANPHGVNMPNMLSLYLMLALFGIQLELEKSLHLSAMHIHNTKSSGTKHTYKHIISFAKISPHTWNQSHLTPLRRLDPVSWRGLLVWRLRWFRPRLELATFIRSWTIQGDLNGGFCSSSSFIFIIGSACSLSSRRAGTLSLPEPCLNLTGTQ